MEESTAISLHNISKTYRLYSSPRDRILEAFNPFKKKYHQEFQAVNGIDMEIPKGQTVAIVGRNGSGKSTLLQIICSVLQPTTGSVSVRGKISALLELGTGFNPEFTGRENVMMNGMVAGFSPEEMKTRLPLIQEFANIGDFFEQPVKIYSSGMFVRLAFASAINIDPEILIVDEALAVGDAKFQVKCYNKFHEFKEAGKTILFVTHDMDTVVRHCDLAFLLEKGQLVKTGKPKEVVDAYYEILFEDTQGLENQQEEVQLIEEGFEGFNILSCGSKIFALLQREGSFELDKFHNGEYENCYSSNSVEEIKLLIAREIQNSVKSLAPTEAMLLEENFYGFNVLSYGEQVIAIGQEEGAFDYNKVLNGEYQRCYTGDSPERVKQLIKPNALERFLKEIPTEDRCPTRKHYNPEGQRFGDKRAEIIDFLIHSEGEYEPEAIYSGNWLDIYIKVKAHEKVKNVNYGFCLKSADGVVLLGTNAAFDKIGPLPTVETSEIVIFKMSIEMKLQAENYFINLAVGERISELEDQPFDRRWDIVHIQVLETRRFEGIASLDYSFNEVRKTSPIPI